MTKERNEPDPAPENAPQSAGDSTQNPGQAAGTDPVPKAPEPTEAPKGAPTEGSTQNSAQKHAVEQKKRRRRRRRPPQDNGLERISEVHYCRTDAEANQYLALGPEWDLQDIIPMRVETEDGGERDEVHFVVARWENERDRAKLRKRDRRGVPRRPRE